MKLMTKELEKKLPRLGATSELKPENVTVYVKLFDPTGSGTWYVTEYDPKSRMCFGYVTGLGYNELGEFSLNELELVEVRFGLKIERDMWFEPKSLAKIMEENPPGHGQ